MQHSMAIWTHRDHIRNWIDKSFSTVFCYHFDVMYMNKTTTEKAIFLFKIKTT